MLGARVQRSGRQSVADSTTEVSAQHAHGKATEGDGLIRRGRVRGVGHEIVLVHQAASVPLARRVMLDDLRCSVGDGELWYAAAVVVSELVGNAVRHATATPDGAVIVRWQVRGGVVDLEVTDGGSESDVRPARPTMDSTSGRGLRIVRHLADEWGVQQDGSSGMRTVWAALGGPSRRRRPMG